MPFGISSAPKHYLRRQHEIMQGLKNIARRSWGNVRRSQ